MNYTIDGEEFQKCAGLKDKAISLGKKVINYSPNITGQEEGLKGMNRIRQVLKGDKAKKYFDEYSKMPSGLNKEKMMRQLVDEDTKTLQGRMLAGTLGVGGGIGAMEGMNYLGGKVIEGGGYLARKGLLGAKDIKVKEEKDPKQNFQNQMQSIQDSYGKIPRELIERMGHPGYTDKLTLNEIAGIPTEGALAGATLGLTGKTMMSNLFGAQTFYHGTPKENVKSILQNGIDPSYGGREGGGAWKIDQKARVAKDIEQRLNNKGWTPSSSEEIMTEAKKKLKDIVPDRQLDEFYSAKNMAESLKPKMKLMGINKEIPMDTTNFVENAKDRSFVAKGLPGRAAATMYGRITDPKAIEDAHKLFQGTEEKFKPLVNFSQKHPIAAIPVGAMYGATKMPFDMISEGKKYYDRFVTPKDTNVVGGVLPQEIFDKTFERDPDDIMRMQSGYRTKTKIEPKNLAPNEVSIKQIWQNRTKNYGQYFKNNKGKALAGMGLLGLNGLMTGSTLYNAGRAINKIVPDVIKNKVKEKFNN